METKPKIAIPNIFGQETKKLKEFAEQNKICAIDWTMDPSISTDIFLNFMKELDGFDVRFHGKLVGMDLADEDGKSNLCYNTYKRCIELVRLCGGKYLTIHLGLGVVSFYPSRLIEAVEKIKRLNEYAQNLGIIICLENLAKGWTSEPESFLEIVKNTGIHITYDIGHAKTKIYPSENGLLFYSKFIQDSKHLVKNSHIYDYEIPKKGHIPPKSIDNIKSRLDILSKTSCDFWVIELFSTKEILEVKDMISTYLR